MSKRGLVRQRIPGGGEPGQGTLEYVGMIALAVLLVLAIVAAFGKGTSLAHVISGAIGKITGI